MLVSRSASELKYFACNIFISNALLFLWALTQFVENIYIENKLFNAGTELSISKVDHGSSKPSSNRLSKSLNYSNNLVFFFQGDENPLRISAYVQGIPDSQELTQPPHLVSSFAKSRDIRIFTSFYRTCNVPTCVCWGGSWNL